MDMDKLIHTDDEYKQWITDICRRFRSSQIKAASKVNVEMLRFYWGIGEDIANRSSAGQWGDKIITHMSRDLQQNSPMLIVFHARICTISRSSISFILRKKH